MQNTSTIRAEEARAAVRELIGQADEAGLSGLPDEEICLVALRALADDGPYGGLRALCGGRASIAVLCEMMTGSRLQSLIEQAQAWTSDWTVALYQDADGKLAVDDAWRIGNAQAFIDALVEDGVMQIGQTPFCEPYFRLSADVPGMSLRNMAWAVRKAHLLQYRRPGESHDRLGRGLDGDRNGLMVRCEASGEEHWVAYRSIRFDGHKAVHDVSAIQPAQSPELPVSVIPVAHFDPAGDPELRLFASGAIELALRVAPPSWETEPARFDAFAASLAEAAQQPVSADGTGVFRMERSDPRTLSELLEFLQGHRAVRRGQVRGGASEPARGAGADHPKWGELMAAADVAQGLACDGTEGKAQALVGLLQMFNRLGLGVLRECFGTPLDPAALGRWLPPQLLGELAQACQRWHDGAAPLDRHKQSHYASARALLGVLIEDGIVRLRPTMAGGRLQFIVELPAMQRGAA